MADNKEFPLSIVLRTVDKATAGLQRFNHQIEETFKPYKSFGKQLGELSENLGLPKVKESLGKIGSEVKGLVKEIALLGVEGLVVGEEIFRRTIESGAKLKETADIIGLSVDALAQLRFAAKQSGVATEEMDGALEKFSKNLGLLKANSGPLKEFLQKVSPALLHQVKAAKSNEEAFNLMADAMAKVKDPAKKAALVTEAFGRGGQPLINLLSKGKVGINELREEFMKLAGSQEGFATQSKEMKDVFGKVEAAMGGVVAQIVVALKPAIAELTERFTKFIVGHREQIAQWANDFAKKLPDIIKWIGELFDKFKSVWDAIGGAKGAFLIFAGIKLAPLLGSVGELVISLGKMVIAIRAANAASSGGGGAGGGVGGGFGGALGKLSLVGGVSYGATSFADRALGLSNKIAGVSGSGVSEHRSLLMRALSGTFGGPNIKEESDLADVAANRALAEKVAAIRAHRSSGSVDVNVNIAGLPPGSRADVKSSGPVQSDLTTGYMMPP